ncbi:hypothetical protein [Paraburkholderia nodosa]|uniref:hypothetical protein n=1 Tax=Paraburkholderia nodosa TaxID=392320 RepID=UPI000489B2C2|nr:hypothetical protein [Paraburkholderia nodosa]
MRWTLTALKRGCPSLADAKREHPAVFALLLEYDVTIEYWEHGRLRVVPAASAPDATTVLARALRQHRRRFRLASPGDAPGGALAAQHPANEDDMLQPAGVEPGLAPVSFSFSYRN